MKNDKSTISLIRCVVKESLFNMNEAGHGGTILPSKSTIPFLKHLDSYSRTRSQEAPTWEMLEKFLTKLSQLMDPTSSVGGYRHLVNRAWELLKGRYNPSSILSGETNALAAEKAMMKALGVVFKNAPKNQPEKIGTPDAGFSKIFGGVIESWDGFGSASTKGEEEPSDPEIARGIEKDTEREPVYRKIYSRFFSK